MIKLKQVFIFTASTLLLAVISGCSSANFTAQKPECGKDTIGAPSWVCSPQSDEGYAGVGVAEKNAGSPEQMKQAAFKNVRFEIAKQMQVELKNKIDNLSRISENKNKEAVDNLVASISKEIFKTHITLAKMGTSWTSASGKLYILGVAPKSDFNADLKKAILSSYAKDKDIWLNYQANHSIDDFEKEFALLMPKKSTNDMTTLHAFQVETVKEVSVGRNRKK